MAKLNVRDALQIAEQDSAGHCRTCTELALEMEEYCWHCKTYWEDVANGLWSEDDFQWLGDV